MTFRDKIHHVVDRRLSLIDHGLAVKIPIARFLTFCKHSVMVRPMYHRRIRSKELTVSVKFTDDIAKTQYKPKRQVKRILLA